MIPFIVLVTNMSVNVLFPYIVAIPSFIFSFGMTEYLFDLLIDYFTVSIMKFLLQTLFSLFYFVIIR